MYFLGIDLGTTGLKAVIADIEGNILGKGYRQYPLEVPHPGYAEQSPEAWYEAMCLAVRDVLTRTGIAPDEIRSIGFSGQMHGLVALDRDGNVLCPAIIHCDGRAFREKQKLCTEITTEQFGEWVQNRPNSGFQIVSLMWLRNNRPEIYAKIWYVLLPKDYLRYRLTGNYASEVTDACSTLMFDCKKMCWNNEILQAADIDPGILPDAGNHPYEISGEITAQAAADTGLCKGTIVAFGGGDTPISAVANGILSDGDASVNIGTSAQLLVAMSEPRYDPQLRTHTFCHVPENRWYIMGATLNGCLAQNWFDRNVLNEEDFVVLGEKASDSPAGAKGLLFLPYLTGERTPHMNERASGAFIGLTLAHDRYDMHRAVLEGVGFALRDCLEIMNSLNVGINRLLISGGGGKSPLWRQIVADIFEMPIRQTDFDEQAAMGAILCAQIAAGAYPSFEAACAAQVRDSGVITEPDPKNFEIYREEYQVFREGYTANKTLFERLRETQK